MKHPSSSPIVTLILGIVFVFSAFTWAMAQKPPPKKAATAKTWLAPQGEKCPIFRYGPDTELSEAQTNCLDYCTKTKVCKICEKRSGPSYPVCK